MSVEQLKYDQMVEDALRGVVKQVLEQVIELGALPGNHHFFITFKTAAAGVKVPSQLAEKYPDEMTIVLQYQYWDLMVNDERFEVTLSFNDKREHLVIPMGAMTGFVDPSVKFLLQFKVDEALLPANPDGVPVLPRADVAADANADDAGAAPSIPGEVVSLDQFRKKK